MICDICPRECRAERSELDGGGLCGCGMNALVARAAAHFGEEPCISGTRGSGAVFFGGCSLRCVFCQNAQISRKPFGKILDANGLRAVIDKLAQSGVHNINLVSGTHFTPLIASALEKPLGIPVVWNSSGYEKPETLRLLENMVQIYLPDMKYSDAALASRYSGAHDYPETAKAAILEMYRQVGDYELDGDGLLKKGVVIRHLALPGALDNTRGVIDWVGSTFRKGAVLFSLMGQYTPCGELTDSPELKRPLYKREYEKLCDYLYESGIEDGFVQQLSSAKKDFIPAFDLTGVE